MAKIARIAPTWPHMNADLQPGILGAAGQTKLRAHTTHQVVERQPMEDQHAHGYIRLYRSLSTWEWYRDDACLRLLIHLLMRVNWKPARWRGINIEPGSTVTSMEQLADSLGWTRSKLRRTMDKLKSSGDVTTKAANKWTAITLVNWAKYQRDDHQSGLQPGQLAANKRPTDEAAGGQQTATIEEGKNEIRKEVLPQVDLIWPAWAGPNTKATWEEFKAERWAVHRIKYKTRTGEQKAINMMGQYYTSGPACVEGLNEAIAKGWRFPVDPTTRNSSRPVEEPTKSTMKSWVQ